MLNVEEGGREGERERERERESIPRARARGPTRYARRERVKYRGSLGRVLVPFYVAVIPQLGG